MNGENATKQLTQDYWEQKASSEQNLIVEAQLQIGSGLALVGKHNYKVEWADLYCGLGVMVHLLRDAHYDNIVGIDNDPNVQSFWEDDEGFIFQDPLHLGLKDDSFTLVTCFDGSRTEDHPALLREMARISSRYILFRPDSKPNHDLHEETMRLFLAERLKMTRYNAPNGWYTIEVN